MRQKKTGVVHGSILRHHPRMDFFGEQGEAAVLVIDEDESRRSRTVATLNDELIDTYDVPFAFDALDALGRGTFRVLIVCASKRLLAVKALIERAQRQHPDLQVLLELPIDTKPDGFALGSRGRILWHGEHADWPELVQELLGVEDEPQTLEISPAVAYQQATELSPIPAPVSTEAKRMAPVAVLSELEGANEGRTPTLKMSSSPTHALGPAETTSVDHSAPPGLQVPAPFTFGPSKPEPRILGELDPDTNAALLLRLAVQGATGELRARQGEEAITLSFYEGKICPPSEGIDLAMAVGIFFVSRGGAVVFHDAEQPHAQTNLDGVRDVFTLILGSVQGHGATLAEIRIDPLPALSSSSAYLESLLKGADVSTLVGQGIPAYNLATALDDCTEFRGNEVIAAMVKARLCLALSDDREPTQRIVLTAPGSTLSDMADDADVEGLAALLEHAHTPHQVLGVPQKASLDMLRLAYEDRVHMLGTACVDPSRTAEERQRAVALRMELKRAYDRCRKARIAAS